MYVSDYLDVVWARLTEQYGGFDSPMEFREMLHDIVFKGQQPKKRDKQPKNGKPRPRAPKPDMKKIQELQAKLGK